MSTRPGSVQTARRVAWSLGEVLAVPSAVTVGFFDGVHRGHQLLVDRTRQHAMSGSLRTVAATFDRHPTQVIRPGSEPPLLMTLARRIRTLHEVGADFVLVIPFTVELSELSPQAFVDTVLVKTLSAEVVVVGENFRFGHLAAGDARTLRELGSERGLEVEVVELLTLDDLPISSTEIRRHIALGDVQWAAAALGRPHIVDGVVVQGQGRGRSIGIPTANIEVAPHTQLPAKGVYAGHVVMDSGVLPTPPATSRPRASQDRSQLPEPSFALPPDGGSLRVPAVMNIGVRPTFGGRTLTVEAHLLDFEADLYGAVVAVELEHRLREERRFAAPKELVAQIRADIAHGRDLLGLAPRPFT
ncbi:MAG: bifunctional riboflavin kinase/FAD synthetase [Nitriliruptorales bacterium]